MDNTCISLSQSVACPIYNSYSVQPSVLFKNVEEFDQLVMNRIRSDFSRICPDFKNEGLRYQISVACSIIVGVTKGDCSNPPPICAGIITSTIESMNTLARGSCKNSIPAAITNHLTQVSTFGTDCSPANTDEIDKCGYSTLEEQKQYCFMNDFKDNCCLSQKSLSNKSISMIEVLETSVKFDQKKNDYRYLGTSMFIFASIGSSIASIVIATLIIFLILKKQIQKDKKPLQTVRLSTRTSFYF